MTAMEGWQSGCGEREEEGEGGGGRRSPQEPWQSVQEGRLGGPRVRELTR